jgi:outer membrane protein
LTSVKGEAVGTEQNAPQNNTPEDFIMKAVLPLLVTACLGLGSFTAAHAADNSWIVHVGAHVVAPASNNGTLAGMKADIGRDTKPTVSLEYMITPSWSVDLLAALPFKHDVRLNGQQVVTSKQLPPTLGVNYHFMPDAKVSPFIGAGINYTRFFETRGTGALQGASVKIDNSWGAAAHAGVDFKLSPKWLFTADVRWINIGGNVHVNGADVGKAKVNPLVYGVSFGYRF